MSIQVKHQSFADGETLDISGVKRGKGSPANIVRLKFDNLQALKEFQDELNYRFPENVKTMQEMPTEEGYYITQTGTLLYCDGKGDWSVRRPTLDDGKYGTEPLNRVWSDGLPASHVTWPLVVSTFGAVAFPLVPVKFAY